MNATDDGAVSEVNPLAGSGPPSQGGHHLNSVAR